MSEGQTAPTSFAASSSLSMATSRGFQSRFKSASLSSSSSVAASLPASRTTPLKTTVTLANADDDDEFTF